MTLTGAILPAHKGIGEKVSSGILSMRGEPLLPSIDAADCRRPVSTMAGRAVGELCAAKTADGSGIFCAARGLVVSLQRHGSGAGAQSGGAYRTGSSKL